MNYKAIKEQTDGTHIYMRIKFEDDREEEIDVYIKEDEKHYITTQDGDISRRNEIIEAFNALY